MADPNISIRDLMQAFQNHVVQCNNYDFLDLVNCPGHCKWSWKTSPHPSWMCKIHRLVGSLLGVAPNGVLPSAKVRQSLMKLAELMKINQTRSNTSDFADKCDERIRIVMSQYRLVKNNPYEYQRLMKKATPEEKLCIDRTLSLLSVDAAPSSTTIDEIGGSSQLAMVPYVPGKVGSLPSSHKKIFSARYCQSKTAALIRRSSYSILMVYFQNQLGMDQVLKILIQASFKGRMPSFSQVKLASVFQVMTQYQKIPSLAL